MPRTLFITTELPYFPGQGGLMGLHMQYLAHQGMLGIVGPRYARYPEEPVRQLRRAVPRSYWWPESAAPGDLPALAALRAGKSGWLRFLPVTVRRELLQLLAGLSSRSNEALAWRIALAQIAPKVLEALAAERWNAVLLSQSNSAAWFRFLPRSLARCLYLHDIRSDYLARAPSRPPHRWRRKIRQEEQLAVREVQSLAVISELDRARAIRLLAPRCPIAVVPVCVDPDYFAFEPPPESAAPCVLFTGHLSHPPNIDAIVHFLEDIWPDILAAVPEATCRVVGLQPSAKVVAAVERAPQTELAADVPDIRPYFRAARVFVIPMRYGGGVRQKMVEAWAMGVPVVTTAMGADGLEARHGGNCWIADAPEDFARQVADLLRHPAPRPVLTEARAEAVAKHRSSGSSPRLQAQINVAAERSRLTAPRVLFDLRWLNPGQVGGVEQMTRELVGELGSYDRVFEYRLFGSAAALQGWNFAPTFRHRIIATDGVAGRLKARRDAAVNEIAEGLALPPLMTPEVRALEWYAGLDFTVVHGLSGTIHPDLRRFPSVLTVHDLQHLHLPRFFSAEDISTREREYGASCRQASHIICTSEFTRRDVHTHYGIPLEKMTTIWNLPPGVTGSPVSATAARDLLRRMGVKAPFLFYPAHPWLHKNHRVLLEAMALLYRVLPSDYTLVLTSQPFPESHPASALLSHPRLRNRVRHLGYRTPAEIAALFSAAEALVFPSLFEGFGLPLVEAMQQNCPILCGHHSSIPEIAGDAALYAEVSSPDALASAILSVTRDTALRARLRENGRRNLLRFDRRVFAERTREIYASVHDGHFSQADRVSRP
ncbi:MAG TPA: glycosyltransferase [Candidatus Didemnitutus sp.]